MTGHAPRTHVRVDGILMLLWRRLLLLQPFLLFIVVQLVHNVVHVNIITLVLVIVFVVCIISIIFVISVISTLGIANRLGLNRCVERKRFFFLLVLRTTFKIIRQIDSLS